MFPATPFCFLPPLFYFIAPFLHSLHPFCIHCTVARTERPRPHLRRRLHRRTRIAAVEPAVAEVGGPDASGPPAKLVLTFMLAVRSIRRLHVGVHTRPECANAGVLAGVQVCASDGFLTLPLHSSWGNVKSDTCASDSEACGSWTRTLANDYQPTTPSAASGTLNPKPSGTHRFLLWLAGRVPTPSSPRCRRRRPFPCAHRPRPRRQKRRRRRQDRQQRRRASPRQRWQRSPRSVRRPRPLRQWRRPQPLPPMYAWPARQPPLSQCLSFDPLFEAPGLMKLAGRRGSPFCTSPTISQVASFEPTTSHFLHETRRGLPGHSRACEVCFAGADSRADSSAHGGADRRAHRLANRRAHCVANGGTGR